MKTEPAITMTTMLSDWSVLDGLHPRPQLIIIVVSFSWFGMVLQHADGTRLVAQEELLQEFSALPIDKVVDPDETVHAGRDNHSPAYDKRLHASVGSRTKPTDSLRIWKGKTFQGSFKATDK